MEKQTKNKEKKMEKLTSQRCLQIAAILKSRNKNIAKRQEQKRIMECWENLPGWACFFDACIVLAHQLEK